MISKDGSTYPKKFWKRLPREAANGGSARADQGVILTVLVPRGAMVGVAFARAVLETAVVPASVPGTGSGEDFGPARNLLFNFA